MARHPEGNLTHLLSDESMGEAEACEDEGRDSWQQRSPEGQGLPFRGQKHEDFWKL